MKAKIMNLITLTLLFCLLLTAVACGDPNHHDPENTQKPAASGTYAPENGAENIPATDEGTENAPNIDGSAAPETNPQLPADPEDPEIGTDFPTYPGDIEVELPDIEVELPELQETSKIILSIKNGKVLGASSLEKPVDSDIIDSYSDFQKLYGTVEGIDEAFFETHSLRLVHTAQSSGSTRYAVESVVMENGELKVKIIEQFAAISTRDLKHWFVFIAVEKDMAETPVEVNISGIQLTQ